MKPSVLHATFYVAAVGCSTKPGAPAGTQPSSQASSTASRRESPPPPTPPWQRQTKPAELLCSEAPEMTGPYATSLRAGRKAAAAKRWGEAANGFRQALADRPEDPVALSELSWALLSAGDAPHALEAAELAVGRTTDPKQKASALYNAGRAAEALGDLTRARSLLQASLKLRTNDTVQQRLEHLAAPAVRAAPATELWRGCQGLPSAAAVCDCLAELPANGSKGDHQCEATESKGEHGRVVAVSTNVLDREDYEPARKLVLVAKLGATWSALQLVAEADAVDLAEQPRASEGAAVSAYEELPYRGGTLLWVQTVSEFSETAMGETVERGQSALTLCWVRDQVPTTCARSTLAEWDYSFEPSYADDGDRCQVRKFVHYRIDAASSGALQMVLESGRDELALVGRYRLPLTAP